MAAPKLKIVESAQPEGTQTTLPDYAIIGAYQYDIHEMSELERVSSGNMGYCNEGSLEMAVAIDGIKPQMQAEIMVHEILHALFGAGSLRTEGPLDEEQVVTVLAKGLLQVARDNPHILRWLSEQYPVKRAA